MKQALIFLQIIIISLLAISCGDIVDSDKNILKTKINYKYVLDNQDSGVLMPLAVGNIWYYKVTESDKEVYYDSIDVVGEQIINDEKWFEVYFPFFSREQTILMTNTDVGLWVKSDELENESFLLAQYPVKGEVFISSLPFLGNVQIEKVISEENINTELGEYQCIRFDMSADNPSGLQMTEYYSVNKGLIKAELLNTNGNTILYELVRQPIFNYDPDPENCKYQAEIYPENIEVSQMNFFTIELTNIENTAIIISELILSNEFNLEHFSVSNDVKSALPLVLAPQERLDIRIEINPGDKRRITEKLKVMSGLDCYVEYTIVIQIN
jgi:hypothetical protein